jgi:hypothetical protein
LFIFLHKTHLRKTKARTKPSLDEAIAKALDFISVMDISGWFAKDGYSI